MDIDDTTTSTQTTQESKQETTQEPKQETASPSATKAEGEGSDKQEVATKPTQKVKTAADGEEVELDDNERVSLPFSTFQKRIKQGQRAVLREVFGTDNVDELKRRFGDGQKALERAEKIKKEQLTEAERYKAELEEERKRRTHIEQELSSYREEQEASKGEKIVRGVASKYVSDDYADDAVVLFQRHLSSLDDDELEGLKSSDIDDWFKEFVTKRPAMKRDAKSEPRREAHPINNGSTGKKPDDSRTTSTSKTPRPGKANSMSTSEWEAWKREHGLEY